MALLSDISPPTVNPSLNVFDISPSNVLESEGRFISYTPVSDITLNELSPIEFYAPATDLSYIDLAKTRLFVTLNITKGNENLKFTTEAEGDLIDPTKSSVVALVNNPLHSLFTSVELFLNDQLLSSASTNNYPYLSYLQKILNTSASVKNGKLTGAGFYLDTSFGAVAKNKGFVKRLSLTQNSQDVELTDTLDLDLFHQYKYLLSGINVKIRLNRSSNNFALQKAKDDPTTNYKINIKAIKLVLRKILPQDNILIAHNQLLSKHNAVYEYERMIFRHFNIPTGNANFVLENAFQGLVPQRVIFMMLPTSDFQGDMKSNPFNFKHNSLSHLSLYIDSTPLLDQTFNFTNGAKYIEAFSNLYFHLGYSNPSKGDIQISREQFLSGFCIFCFDTNPDLGSAGNYLGLNRTGNLRLNLDFATALTDSTTLIMVGVFSNMIQITADRQVLHDFRI